jgi:quercetin dioxygenase-like cupin family protein
VADRPRTDGEAVDLQAVADELLAQASGEHSRRAARTLPHSTDALRHTMIALLAGAELQEHNNPPGPAVLLVLRGQARLVAGEQVVPLRPLLHAPIPPRRHSLEADADTVVLLTVVLLPRSGHGWGDAASGISS